MPQRKSPAEREPPAEEIASDELARLSAEDRAELERFRRAHETQVLTIFFSDLVGSTRLQTELGNLQAAKLVLKHYTIVRDVLSRFDGREIKTAGDSMLIVFAAPSEAVKFALHAQRAMRAEAEQDAWLPAMRAGVHQGQVVLERRDSGEGVVDVYGLQVSTAARIMDLAAGGQILLSRAVFDDARAILRAEDFPGFGRLAWRNHGAYRFKGVADGHDICEVGEDGRAPLTPPPAGSKGWPADQSAEELGWRPARGVVVPETNWRLVVKLGEGEFGEVWKAFNLSDKSHQVFKFCFKRDRLPALKREARLLKRLKKYAHPNLVEVYDVTEGDRPPHYLEMEYVDGPTLQAWLAEAPPLNERLQVVAQIADALDTVHAAGIYHRDIKPSNILLTRREDGAWRGKLTDFGLGAAQDPDLLRSIFASRVEGLSGTWDYIAPELRHGGPPSAQSDIYSLGLTLYQVVVGDIERPLTGDWERQVPSAVLCEDIRRCVSQSPADRWPRAADLAQALRSHEPRLRQRELEREHENQRLRARRFRHAALLASAIAAILLLCGGIAVYQWREAARQRDRALAQKRLALLAISQLTHDVPQRLRNVPGTLPILQGLLEENIALIDRILALEPDTPLARRERGANLIAVGDRWMLVGNTPRALAAYESGLRIAQQLLETQPDRPEFQRDVSMAFDRLGDVHIVQGKAADGLAAYQRSWEITEALAQREPTSRAARRDVWLALDKLGAAYSKLGRTQEALESYEEALSIATQLVDEQPDHLESLRDLSLCYERVGDVRLVLGRADAALAAYEHAMRLGRQCAEAEPESAEGQRGLSVGYDKLGSVYLRVGRATDALEVYQASLRIARSMSAKEPENAQLLRDVSVAIDRVGDVQLALGQPADALASFQQALEMAERLAARDPDNASAQFDLLAGYVKVGDALVAAGRGEDALASYGEALAINRQLATADPNDAQVQRSLSVALSKLGSVQFVLGMMEAAAQSLTEAVAVAQRRADADPVNVETQRDLGVSCYKFMLVCQALEDVGRWRAAARMAVEQFAHVAAKSEGDARSKVDLVNALRSACGGALILPELSSDDWQMALTWCRQLVELSDHASPEYLAWLATFQALTHDLPGALASVGKALSLCPAGEDGADLRRRLSLQLEELKRELAAER